MPSTVPATNAAIQNAAKLLREGRLVAFPTETVYGLGADAWRDEAVASIYRAKGRPSHNPLIVHIHDMSALMNDVAWNPMAETLAARFWPGPLTLVLKRAPGCRLSPLVSAGGDTVALRMPAHPTARALLKAAGVPVAAPSANRSGSTSPTQAGHVTGLAEDPAMILDGGPCPVGIESTVVDVTGAAPRLLRPGSITAEDIAETAGLPVTAGGGQDKTLRSPGLLASHYAPRLPVRLNAASAAPDEALLAFGPSPPQGARATLNLSPSGDPKEAARNLFDYLRKLDESGASAIAVMPIPATGIGLAINDRLTRAAAPKG